MTRLLLDTSVVLKWFHDEGESEVPEARRLRGAHVAGELSVHLLDLAIYELGNVLVRSLSWTAPDTAEQLDDVLAICGVPLVMDPAWLPDAATLAVKHALAFSDAAWAAAARGLGVPLVSADRQPVGARLATTPTQAVRRLGL